MHDRLDETFYVEPSSVLDGEDQEMVKNLMVRCSNCGEYRSRDDPAIKKIGICYLCSIDGEHKEARQREIISEDEDEGNDDEEDDE